MKGFPTLEGFFTIAGHVTLDKNRVIVEGLSTFTALRGLPASVDLVVVREVWPLVKDLPTLCIYRASPWCDSSCVEQNLPFHMWQS